MVEYLSGGRLQGITASLDNLKAYYNFDESSGNLINQQTTGDGLGSAGVHILAIMVNGTLLRNDMSEYGTNGFYLDFSL